MCKNIAYLGFSYSTLTDLLIFVRIARLFAWEPKEVYKRDIYKIVER